MSIPQSMSQLQITRYLYPKGDNGWPILLVRRGSSYRIDYFEWFSELTFPSLVIRSGNEIAKYLVERLGHPACKDLTHQKKFKCKLLVSPFRRTRETASLLLKTDLGAWITGTNPFYPNLHARVSFIDHVVEYLRLQSVNIRCRRIFPVGRTRLGYVRRHRTSEGENIVRKRIRPLTGRRSPDHTVYRAFSLLNFSAFWGLVTQFCSQSNSLSDTNWPHNTLKWPNPSDTEIA